MSRFGRNRKSEASSREGGSSNRGSSRRGGSRRGKKSDFRKVGGLTLTKAYSKKLGQDSDVVVDELRDDDIQLSWKVYLPEGVEELILNHDDLVFVQIGKVNDKAPDFIVGSVSIPPKK